MEQFKISDDKQFATVYVKIRRKVTSIHDTLKGGNLSTEGYWPQRFPCILWVHGTGDLVTTYPDK